MYQMIVKLVHVIGSSKYGDILIHFVSYFFSLMELGLGGRYSEVFEALQHDVIASNMIGLLGGIIAQGLTTHISTSFLTSFA